MLKTYFLVNGSGLLIIQEDNMSHSNLNNLEEIVGSNI